MQTIIAALVYLGLAQSPSASPAATTSATAVSSATATSGTPVIIDIQEF